jgi:hypothetical protein
MNHTHLSRAYYSKDILAFLEQTPDEILGEITRNNQFALVQRQRNTWIYEIVLLKQALEKYSNGFIAFEYTIPRIGDRVDNLFIFNGVIYLIEFKFGEKHYLRYAVDQVMDYALDLKYFHKESRTVPIVPIVACTEAPSVENTLRVYEDGVYEPLLCNKNTLKSILAHLTSTLKKAPIKYQDWLHSPYMPTPTIIEAAQALYRGHNVAEISRNDADAYNLSVTTNELNKIIDQSKQNNEKSICFVTGVPGSGKTLAGLNIANTRHNFDEKEHAVFLSGNGPLVFVLREALARDEYARNNHTMRKSQAKKKAEAFIQNIHHFRDDALLSSEPPIEKVTVFDEAQRAWTQQQTAKFMAERGILNFNMSEPEFLISIMNRHKDWAVIICLVGGGQEINTGEAGLPAWYDALRKQANNWKVYVSSRISDEEYTLGNKLNEMLLGLHVNYVDELHLAVSVRSFRSEQVAAFVKSLLDIELNTAQRLYLEIKPKYPIFLTRDLEKAKAWVKSRARGTERYGLIASSGAKRLRNFGVWVQYKITPEYWFLNDKDDVRSSFFLEETATQFDIQGLEIDWTILAWDADYRFENNCFTPYNFTGTKWNTVRAMVDHLYLKNAYRVLLTRARQGFIIYIPKGDDHDKTRLNKYYDGTYNYLKQIGIEEI